VVLDGRRRLQHSRRGGQRVDGRRRAGAQHAPFSAPDTRRPGDESTFAATGSLRPADTDRSDGRVTADVVRGTSKSVVHHTAY